jgi:hypothetical protein
MKLLALVVLCLGAFGIVLPAALYFGDRVLSSGDPPNMQDLTLSDWLREGQRESQLNADGTIISRVNNENVAIIDALIEGRLSLRAAAAAMCAVGENKPAHLRIVEGRLPEQAVEEHYVRRAFKWADYTLIDDPRREAVMTRLQAELDDYLYMQEVQP